MWGSCVTTRRRYRQLQSLIIRLTIFHSEARSLNGACLRNICFFFNKKAAFKLSYGVFLGIGMQLKRRKAFKNRTEEGDSFRFFRGGLFGGKQPRARVATIQVRFY